MAELDAELQAAGKLQMLEQPQHIAAERGGGEGGEAAKVEGNFSLPLHAISLLITERR